MEVIRCGCCLVHLLIVMCFLLAAPCTYFLTWLLVSYLCFLSFSLWRSNEAAQVGNCRTVNAKVANVGPDVMFGRDYSGQRHQQDISVNRIRSPLSYSRNSVNRRSAVRGSSISNAPLRWRSIKKLLVYDPSCRACNTAVGAHVQKWKSLERACAGIFICFESMDLPLVCHKDKVEFVRRLNNRLLSGANTKTMNLACCYW